MGGGKIIEWDETPLMIGVAIISEFHEYWIESGDDDLEYIITISIVIRGISVYLKNSETSKQHINSILSELKKYAKILWIDHCVDVADDDESESEVRQETDYFFESVFDNHEYPDIIVLEQQCVVKEPCDQTECDTLAEIEIREKPVGEKIISSSHNTDAEYTRKRDQKVVGHKGFLTETCDPENSVQFMTDTNLEKATHSDSQEISRVEDRLEENSSKPEELYGDAGFVNGKSILEAERIA